MDLEHPFGVAFGPASTRDELIQSAQTLYQRLLKLAPGFYGLPYSVLAVLSDNGDGTVDKNLKKSIETLFRADADGEIPILTFIQSCDVVYRKLRYFRASVGNASVIDKVLENMINGIYNFGLTVVILSLLNFNPWPLLVSVSTLLVSFAFAIGPTAAKAIEVSSTSQFIFEAVSNTGTDDVIIRVSC
jgi:small-conductance mechanosensitive channel